MNKAKVQRFFFYVFITFIMISLSGSVTSCRTKNLSPEERKIQREKKKRAKEDSVLYEKALKRHMKNQTKATRKEMRRNYREAMRYNEQRKEFFLKRWLRERMYQRQKKQQG